MKTIALIMNVVWLGVLIFVCYMQGMPAPSEQLFVLYMVITPLINIIALIGFKEDIWFLLYLKRKALEEKQKIEKLNIK